MAQFKHFFLGNNSTSSDYTSTRTPRGTFRSPPRDSRRTHGKNLVNQLNAAKQAAESREESEPNSAGILFLPLVLEGDLGELDGKKLSGLDLDKLNSDAKEIRVVNVREDGDRQIATVAIPKDQLDYFEKKFTDYLEKDNVREKEDGTKTSKPRNQQLVESIRELRLAALPDFYTDSDGNPPSPDETIWWEVWLEFLPDDQALEAFKESAASEGIEFSDQSVRFPEVVVVLARGTFQQWSQVEGLFRHLAEFRRAKIVASEFMDLPPSDQAEFINDLLERTEFAADDAPAVTILDTGINRAHPLIRPALAEKDTQAWGRDWNSSDVHGHGTEMAGVALFGDRLKDLLIGNETVHLPHRIESVKVLPDVGENEPPDYGPITAESMALAETASPNRQRVFCLAVTADDRDKFLPTLWSAAIDQAVAGRGGLDSRLIAISAGNLFSQPGENYPDENLTSSVQDPAQSWNGLTIGAYTDLVQIAEDELVGWNPVAPKGLLSPTSTTSASWSDNTWPIKPELVLEGGNFATDGNGNFTDAA